MVKSTNYEAPHYEIFSIHLLLSPSQHPVLNLCYSLNVRDQYSHPYKQEVKIYFCIFCIDEYDCDPRVVAGIKNSPNVAHACRKRRLKWAPSAWEYSWATRAPEGI
jgi:hypothetical protein